MHSKWNQDMGGRSSQTASSFFRWSRQLLDPLPDSRLMTRADEQLANKGESSSRCPVKGALGMTLPSFLIIGAQRSGSTTLHFTLARHPQIFMSARKEVNFFLRREDGSLPAFVDDETARLVPPTLADYETVFARAGLTIEPSARQARAISSLRSRRESGPCCRMSGWSRSCAIPSTRRARSCRSGSAVHQHLKNWRRR